MRETRSFNFPTFISVSRLSLLQIRQKRYSNLQSAWDSLARRDTRKANGPDYVRYVCLKLMSQAQAHTLPESFDHY
jgi:hypothetical protein